MSRRASEEHSWLPGHSAHTKAEGRERREERGGEGEEGRERRGGRGGEGEEGRERRGGRGEEGEEGRERRGGDITESHHYSTSHRSHNISQCRTNFTFPFCQ